MAIVAIKIIFSAILEVNQLETQAVKLGGVFPEIEIEQVDSNTGLHYFKIAKSLPHLGPTMIASAVAESELQIDLFWNILSYVGDMTLRNTGKVLYEANGTFEEFNPPVNQTSIHGVAILTENWFKSSIPLFHKKYDLDLLKRYNFSREIQEPIGKFISLYSLLSSRCKDSQVETDKLIKSVEPNVAIDISPIKKRQETIFTKLRNELAHNRKDSSVIETHRNIILHLPRFEWIVKVIVQRDIVVSP
ncbi:hypothetical protein [Nitrosomonas supralitoralis]|uniref:Apea-like HEPN domain-containing protein n=1 Tax=Nitrosomonas supralitoralis TaxID=2116706 RepID=A0A2P7NRM2_9PROT|nr:hypothetical protein [Nitrosomonas supralitoralis]PSJ16087.1 hypothetical protein C7H79_15435 [Nitrosomonas supralitoralis]